MKKVKLETYAKITWCPGCGNFGILSALKEAIKELIIEENFKKENFVLVSGIGCHAKIVDYININTFYSLHGRAIPAAEGIKLANPKLKVIVSAGDGDAYDEGISHLIHAAKRNIDINVLIHDNQNFALTTSQFTATSPEGFKGKSTPKGSIEKPLNPLELMLSSKATFIARSYSARLNHLKTIIKKAIKHQGFSFIDILQPCVSFFNTYQFFNQRVYELENKNLDSKERAIEKIKEWDYQNKDSKIPIGIFYQVQRPSYEIKLLGDLIPVKRNRNIDLKKFLKNLK